MKHFTFLFILLVSNSILKAQDKKMSHPDLKLEYQLPAKWESQVFFKENWEMPGGSSLCECSVAFNSFKIPTADGLDYIYMAIYPSDKKGSHSEKRKGVWQYRFVNVEMEDTLYTESLTWTKQESKFTCIGDNRFKKFKVWRLQSNFNNVYYTLYFWAKPTLFNDYKAVIEKIINSIKPYSIGN